MDEIDSPEWADNPRLAGWLAAQRRAFPAWADENDGDWDFTPASLDRLEALIRSRFADWEAVHGAAGTPLLTVAAWYLGETLIRRCGVMWRCSPVPPPPDAPAGGDPLVTYARDSLTEYELDVLDDLDERLEYSMPLLDPAGAIRSLFAAPDSRLANAVDRFDRFQEWRRSLPDDIY
ncbi:hypothetical protein [Kitasatospora sp. NPDC056531]|uniref:hypothetical protein n=1 Tax=Kitasatospora sp. NPDC056531 TaxID=3345856 RepID=UPI003689F0A9